VANYLITGASVGLGRGLARELCARGHRVWGIARREDKLVELQQELGAEHFLFSVCDLAQDEAVHQAMQAMERSKYIPDTVILNAGINPEVKGQSFKLVEFKHVLEINLFGALAWIELFLPIFRERGSGQFVAMSSLAAYRGDARWVAYSASKSALDRAFESFRGRHAKEGVAFTVIHLGAADVGMGYGSRSLFTLREAKAIRKILNAVERRVPSITIPRILRLVLELMRVMPDELFSRLVLATLRNASTETAKQ